MLHWDNYDSVYAIAAIKGQFTETTKQTATNQALDDICFAT